MSVILANWAAHTILGHGLAFLTNAALTKGLSIVIGPVGWTLAGIMTAKSIGSEAYRITVPCVIQVAMIREATAERMKGQKRKERKRWVLITCSVLAALSALYWIISTGTFFAIH
jgi:hypothetical protein